MNDMLNGFVTALQNDTAYDFICSNGYCMRRDDLTAIVKELLYAIYRAENGYVDPQNIRDEVIENIKDLYGMR